MDENLSLMMVPYKPKEIPDSTDLNIAPLNWLRPIGSTIRPPQKKSKEKRSKKTKMKSSIVANHYLKSHFMGSSQKTLNGVNAVADADTIKNLIKLGKEGLRFISLKRIRYRTCNTIENPFRIFSTRHAACKDPCLDSAYLLAT